MKVRDQADRPAALPLFFFVTALALSEKLVNVSFSIAGTLVIAALLWKLLGNIRASLLIAFLAAGLVVGTRESIRKRTLERIVDSDQFVTVEIPIEGSWNATATGFRLSSSRFRIDGMSFAKPITIHLSATPPALNDQSLLIAEGFLRKTERGRFTLTCKSSLLLRYAGRTSRFHPRLWNRRADERLSQLVHRRQEYLRAGALTKALALGRSDELSPEIREDYRRGGTYHLLVFSGMQIAFAAGALMLLFRVRGNLRLADWSLLALATFAPLFAGSEPSVSRASLMIGIYAASRLLGRPTSLENLFFVSAMARLALRPGELSDPGFALTYAATGGLLFIGRPLARLASHRLTAALLYGLGAEIATVPLTLFFFRQYVLGGSIVTLLLAPLLAVMLAAAAGACMLVFVSDTATGIILDLLGGMDSLATATNLFFGETLRLSKEAAAPPASWVIACFAGFFVIDLLRRKPGIFRGSIVLIPVAISLTTPWRSEVEFPQVEFFYVGQGDAILLRSKGFVLLADGGGRRDDPEFGRRVLLPKLLDRGVARVDAVLLTHPHPDHSGGLPAVLASLDVGELWLSARHLGEPIARDLMNQAFDRRIPVRLIRHGDSLRRDGIDLDFFTAQTRFKRASINNSSLVLKARTDQRAILLTGDIEHEAEGELIGEAPHLGADLLKVPHHGSRTSTTIQFVQAVTPRIAVISCGRRNAFGHPHPSVLERLDSGTMRVLRTDRHGDIRVVIREGHLFVSVEIDTPGGAP